MGVWPELPLSGSGWLSVVALTHVRTAGGCGGVNVSPELVSLSPSSTDSSHDLVADVFALSVEFGSNTSAWTAAAVTVASLNNHFVYKNVVSNRFVVLEFIPIASRSPPSPRCLHRISTLNPFVSPVVLSRPLGTSVLLDNS